jgi:hypothetical protein
MLRHIPLILAGMLIASATAFAQDSPAPTSTPPSGPSGSNSGATVPPSESDALKEGSHDVPPASKKNPATDQPAAERSTDPSSNY